MLETSKLPKQVSEDLSVLCGAILKSPGGKSYGWERATDAGNLRAAIANELPGPNEFNSRAEYNEWLAGFVQVLKHNVFSVREDHQALQRTASKAISTHLEKYHGEKGWKLHDMNRDSTRSFNVIELHDKRRSELLAGANLVGKHGLMFEGSIVRPQVRVFNRKANARGEVDGVFLHEAMTSKASMVKVFATDKQRKIYNKALAEEKELSADEKTRLYVPQTNHLSEQKTKKLYMAAESRGESHSKLQLQWEHPATKLTAKLLGTSVGRVGLAEGNVMTDGPWGPAMEAVLEKLTEYGMTHVLAPYSTGGAADIVKQWQAGKHLHHAGYDRDDSAFYLKGTFHGFMADGILREASVLVKVTPLILRVDKE